MKTNKLTGAALDWAVAKADGKTPKINCTSFRGAFKYCIYLGWRYDNEGRESIVEYEPSTDWARGGPIIEREMIDLKCLPTKQGGFIWRTACADGPTPLIAAMRCYVASKLGDDIEIPEELK